MTTIITALGWAIAILAVAFAGRAGFMPSDTAQTLTIVLPALAVGTMFTPKACAKPCFGASRA